jgi:hypothetical protein
MFIVILYYHIVTKGLSDSLLFFQFFVAVETLNLYFIPHTKYCCGELILEIYFFVLIDSIVYLMDVNIDFSYTIYI